MKLLRSSLLPKEQLICAVEFFFGHNTANRANISGVSVNLLVQSGMPQTSVTNVFLTPDDILLKHAAYAHSHSL